MHKKVLCQKMHYFEATFPDGTASNSVRMPEVDAEAFEILVLWVYGLSVEIYFLPTGNDHLQKSVCDKKISQLVKLCQLAQRFCEDVLMDDVMNALRPIIRSRAIAHNEEVGVA
jgi:hypothetical protein